ncbi:MAG: PQQ-binding-like beta-propeller repeat protein [Gemmatimonadetes bacterium]|nr:PQQ-binding-like beta-propeller repeat protein [Gemmatimonadota bacterium]NIR76951.1 PQQ-binding-like beta-propeller repeat protein [Gemmatimonadota bacterium]NIT85473.1 PQQ-binding-like beta-propeller repeat protein [Gemmatimonadota bacterium]NIU29297.1 PQQ-binding-like beta-propeller repeat protein [Gemmatimonadota bacterium]NIU34374.1 PQQ-binding-like beta-propeller repeat protein [Gemmatimonadota bacterium]
MRGGAGAGALLFLRAAFLAAAAAAQTPAPDGEWVAYGGEPGSARYSALDQIDAGNAGDLEIAWRWSARNFGPRPESVYRVTPLMVDGVLYATAGFRRVAVAIDPATGETLWMHRLDEGERGARAPRINSGRGVAYWAGGEGDEPRVIYITLGYHMIALDAASGRPVEGFGSGGIVDLLEELRVPEGVDPVGSIGSSSPPVVVGDRVIVGSALHVGYRPPSRANVPGDVRAFDARTGALLWSFHVVPGPGELGSDTWEGGSNQYTGNAGVWTPFSADPDLGLVYLPTEAPTHDYYGGHRLGENLFSSSVVALDVETGERVWHYQLVHHDIWDYDTPAPPILTEVEVDGRPVRIVAQITKQGWVYVFDRETGEPVWPIEERPVPRDGVPGDRPSATQPFPTRPPAFTRQGVSEDDLIDFTPELREKALEAVSDLRLGPLFTPVEVSDPEDGYRGTLVVPGSTGGGNWEGGALDPESGVLFVPSERSHSVLGLVPGGEFSDMRYIGGVQETLTVDGIPVLRPPWGQISAIDLGRGEILWEIPNADTPAEIADHPALEGIELPRTGHPTRVGLLATRTLLFAGEGVGGGPVLRAHDKATGGIVAEIALPAPQTGVPMTYMHDGKQYVVLAVGDPDHAAELVALALP